MEKQSISRTKWSKPKKMEEEEKSQKELLPKWAFKTKPLNLGVTCSEPAVFNKSRPKSAPIKIKSSRNVNNNFSSKERKGNEHSHSRKRKKKLKERLSHKSDDVSSLLGRESDSNSLNSSTDSLYSSNSSCHEGGDRLAGAVTSNEKHNVASIGEGEGNKNVFKPWSNNNSKTTIVEFKHSSSSCSKENGGNNMASDFSSLRSINEFVDEVECLAHESDNDPPIWSTTCTSDSCKEEFEDECDVTITDMSSEDEEEVLKELRTHHDKIICVLQQQEAQLYKWQLNQARKLLEAQKCKRLPEEPVTLVKTAEVCVPEPQPTEIPELSTLLKEMVDKDEKCAPVRENLAALAKFELERAHSNDCVLTLFRSKHKRIAMPRTYSACSSITGNRSYASKLGKF